MVLINRPRRDDIDTLIHLAADAIETGDLAIASPTLYTARQLTLFCTKFEVRSLICFKYLLGYKAENCVTSGGFNAEGQLDHLRRGPLCLKHTPHPPFPQKRLLD